MFHKFLPKRSLILQTDHRPLRLICGAKKGIQTDIANHLEGRKPFFKLYI